MIDDWKRTFFIPVDVQMSPSARHLILRYVQHRPVPDASPVTTPPQRPSPPFAISKPHTHTDCHAPSLIQDPETRLGRHGGAAEIKAHPFFLPIDFANLKWMPGPLKVPLRSDDDTSRFPIDLFRQGDNFSTPTPPGPGTAAVEGGGMSDAAGAEMLISEGVMPDMVLPFVGYSFRRFERGFG